MQNDMEPSKAAPLNASKQDGPMPKPHSVSLNDTETRKLMEECKRLQGEMMKLSEENRHLRVSAVGRAGGDQGEGHVSARPFEVYACFFLLHPPGTGWPWPLEAICPLACWHVWLPRSSVGIPSSLCPRPADLPRTHSPHCSQHSREVVVWN